jgi:GT2 family glycosyltransferase
VRSVTPASIIIPTRARPAYLEVTLASIAPAATRLDAEVVVVDDEGPNDVTRELAQRHSARYEPHPAPLGLNAARNTGVERSRGDLVVFVDDDIRASPGWLSALLEAARAHPAVSVFAGPVTPVLEGHAPRGCGRTHSPITALDLGGADRDTRFAWGANMAIRRSALERVGPFDVSLADGGDEQQWQERLRALDPGARVLYVAGAGVEHRRSGADARLRALVRSAYTRGRAARRFDARRGSPPSIASELRTLAGCGGHVLLRRCPEGLTMVAHSAGRVREAVRGNARRGRRSTGADPAHPPAGVAGANGSRGTAEDFLSGTSGTVGGLDAVRRAIADEALDAWGLASGMRVRLALASRRAPPARRVLVLGVERRQYAALARRAHRELLGSRHRVEVHTRPPGPHGKFENLNALLSEHPPERFDWLLVLDDDVELPRGFLDRFVFLCERFSLSLAQPAHRLDSHAAWPVTRRRPRSVVHETSFVEIGPLTAFAPVTYEALLPFPQLRMGWGLDVHWAAIARANGWRCGIVDAVPIRHRAAPAASSYPREQAVDEAREFLARRPYLSASEAQRILTTHRHW